jgi:hypothetical protein
MYPNKQLRAEGAEGAEAEEGWKLPTSGEYLRRKQAQHSLTRVSRPWYRSLQEVVLPELRAVAMRKSSARWPNEGGEGRPTFELQQTDMTLASMNALVQTPPRTVRQP